MSNFLYFFLLENSLNVNCLVYSLALGLIKFKDLDNGSWTANHSSGLLPAYYITNCLISNLISQMEKLAENDEYVSSLALNYPSLPYNEIDNGDSFVALLFTLSGLCILCMMLCLMFFLASKYKRKPLLTQCATFFYTIVTVVLMAHLTDVASDNYYADTLDIINIYEVIYSTAFYRGMSVVSMFLTQMAGAQIVMKLTRPRFQLQLAIIGGILILMHTVSHIVFQVKYNHSRSILANGVMTLPPVRAWRFTRFISRVLVIAWVAATLFYYTIYMKNPRKISYSRRLLMLAFSVWFLLLADMVLTIIMVSRFESDWLIRIWLSLIPQLVDILLLTLIWEWIYSIQFLEKRSELMGVLGRRISIDDVYTFHDDKPSPPLIWARVSDLLAGRRSTAPDNLMSESDTAIATNPSGKSGTSTTTASATLHQPTNQTTHEDHNTRHIQFDEPHDLRPHDTNDSQTERDTLARPLLDGSDSEYEVVDYEIWDDDELPPFEPHPGFSREDYWHDEKGVPGLSLRHG